MKTYFTKLDNPATLPTTTPAGITISPDGVYYALVLGNTPYIAIYKKSGDIFTKLANPAVLPASSGYSISFSPDGLHLAVGHSGTPYFSIYKRSGDTFTKLANPAVLPVSSGDYAVEYSPDGKYFVTRSSATSMLVYKRSGDTYTKLTDLTGYPASSMRKFKFSPDGKYLAVAVTTSGVSAFIYRIDPNDVFTRIPFNSNNTSLGYSIGFSPDSQYLLIGYTRNNASFNSPYLSYYKIGADTFTEIKIIDENFIPPFEGVASTEFSPNGKLLFLGVSSNPQPLNPYSRNQEKLKYIESSYFNSSMINTSNYAFGIAFSPDGLYVALATRLAPYFIIYKISEVYENKIALQNSSSTVIKKSLKTDNLAPVMSNYTSSEGTVIFSSEASGLPAYNVFDSNTNSRWASLSTSPYTPNFIGLNFTTKKRINSYSISIYTNNGVSTGSFTRNPKSWTFEASNNGTDWVVLDTRSNVAFTLVAGSNSVLNFSCENEKYYYYYRLNVSESNGATQVELEGLQFFYSYDKVYLRNSYDEDYLLSNEINSNSSLNLRNRLYNKNIQLTNKVDLNSGNSFKIDIDLENRLRQIKTE